MTKTVGIQDIHFATGHYFFDLKDLAEKQGIDYLKYYKGIGQEKMSVLAEDEDIVTLAASAAKPILDSAGTEGIRTLLFATESGIDQSKAAGVYVHKLLGLPSQVRVLELKQACYSGAGALQVALGIVSRNPEEKVLVIASDVARYDLDSSGEPTQGAAAVAFLVQADPALLAIEPVSGIHTDEVQDFWRPNYRHTALVDGKFSINAYIDALKGSWTDYQNRGGSSFGDIDWFCYHQPFSKMATKAHVQLLALNGKAADKEEADKALSPTFFYNKQLGNSYTASIFLGFLALLDTQSNLDSQRIAFFSYGSGAVSEFFTGTVVPGYQSILRTEERSTLLKNRIALDYDHYRSLHPGTEVHTAQDYSTPQVTTAPFRFVGIKDNSRIYEQR